MFESLIDYYAEIASSCLSILLWTGMGFTRIDGHLGEEGRME